jgi:hypothetical protein
VRGDFHYYVQPRQLYQTLAAVGSRLLVVETYTQGLEWSSQQFLSPPDIPEQFKKTVGLLSHCAFRLVMPLGSLRWRERPRCGPGPRPPTKPQKPGPVHRRPRAGAIPTDATGANAAGSSVAKRRPAGPAGCFSRIVSKEALALTGAESTACRSPTTRPLATH